MKPKLPDEEKSAPVQPRTETPEMRRASHHHRQFEVMGAHAMEGGTRFTVWAPNARAVGVIGTFNHWQCEPLERLDDGTGRWSGVVQGARPGQCYKYRIVTRDGHALDKAWKHVTQVTDRNVILVKGEVVFEGSSAELQSQPHRLDQYLGV